MKQVLILGGGAAGTMTANRLLHRLRVEYDFWHLTVVDRDDDHLYRPGLVAVPFSGAGAGTLVRSRRRYLEPGVELVLGEVEAVDPSRRRVHLGDGRVLRYDYLVVASGSTPCPDRTPGMTDELRGRVHGVSTLDGALALRRQLERWLGGRLVVQVAGTPVTCPVVPLELTFLLDAYLGRRGVRQDTELTLVTPVDGAFAQPVARERFAGMLDARGVRVRTGFLADRLDGPRRTLVSVDGREQPFDLLVTVPTHRGADFVARSGLGDELQDVPVDPGTLMSRAHHDVFAVGDATDAPTPKAASVASFEAEVFAENVVQHDRGLPMSHLYDGHASYLVEAGNGRALLLDLGYDAEPLPGRYPVPVLGPLSRLAETRTNHWARAAMPGLYWHVLLHGRPLPVPSRAPRSRPARTAA